MSGETMDNLLWSDLSHQIKVAHSYGLCAQKYADKMRKRKRFIERLILVVLAIGAVAYKFIPEVTFGSVLLSFVIEFIKNFAPSFTPPDSELSNLDNLYLQYSNCKTDLEDAVLDFRNNPSVSDVRIKGRLTKIKKKMDSLHPQLNALVRKISAKEHEAYEREAIDYINSKYQ